MNPTPIISSTENYPPEDFVMLSDVIPNIVQDIRYYSDNNFVGAKIDGYEQPCALATRRAAEALKKVSDDLLQYGYKLKVFDAYRPQKAVNHFMRWAADISDTKMKNGYYPNIDKSLLFANGYIAEKSGHSRGSTIDLTLVDINTGAELDMGGTFDYFGERSHPDYTDGLTECQYANRQFLQKIMQKHGFKPLNTERWHFTLADEPYPDTYFNFPVKRFEPNAHINTSREPENLNFKSNTKSLQPITHDKLLDASNSCDKRIYYK